MHQIELTTVYCNDECPEYQNVSQVIFTRIRWQYNRWECVLNIILLFTDAIFAICQWRKRCLFDMLCAMMRYVILKKIFFKFSKHIAAFTVRIGRFKRKKLNVKNRFGWWRQGSNRIHLWTEKWQDDIFTSIFFLLNIILRQRIKIIL